MKKIQDPTKEEKKIYKAFLKYAKPMIVERTDKIVNSDKKPDSLLRKATDLIVDWYVDDSDLAFQELNEELAFVWFARSITWAYMKKHGITDLDFLEACHKYSKVMDLFQAEGDYSEDVYVLDDEYFKRLEELPLPCISHIGWLYQYYIADLHDKFYASKEKVRDVNDLIGATGIYTPDWVIRTMNENSLGRTWINHNMGDNPELDEKKESERFGWKYYIETGDQNEEVDKELAEINRKFKDIIPQEIRYLEPCMGCGFILFNALDIFVQIYEDYGIDRKEAIRTILTKNLAGTDIDNKAWRMAKTGLLLRAWEYDNTILDEPIDLKLYCTLVNGEDINETQVMWFGEDIEGLDRLKAYQYLLFVLNDFRIAKLIGSLIVPSHKYNFELLRAYVNSPVPDLGLETLQYQLNSILDFAELLSQKYDVVVTNPPYLSRKNQPKEMRDWFDKGSLHFGEIDPWEIAKEKLAKKFIEMINIPEKKEVKTEQISFI